jgi:hypothetical protein
MNELNKQPYAILRADRLPLAMAGPWERCKDRNRSMPRPE